MIKTNYIAMLCWINSNRALIMPQCTHPLPWSKGVESVWLSPGLYFYTGQPISVTVCRCFGAGLPGELVLAFQHSEMRYVLNFIRPRVGHQKQQSPLGSVPQATSTQKMPFIFNIKNHNMSQCHLVHKGSHDVFNQIAWYFIKLCLAFPL